MSDPDTEAPNSARRRNLLSRSTALPRHPPRRLSWLLQSPAQASPPPLTAHTERGKWSSFAGHLAGPVTTPEGEEVPDGLRFVPFRQVPERDSEESSRSSGGEPGWVRRAGGTCNASPCHDPSSSSEGRFLQHLRARKDKEALEIVPKQLPVPQPVLARDK